MKTREEPPPAPYLRSRSGTPAMLKRTTRTSPEGLWLYRLDYGDVVGTQEWTLPQLRFQVDDGGKWLKRRPADLVERVVPERDGIEKPANVAGEACR